MAESGGNKRLSVERIYQKKSQLEHILLRPDTYIGSVQVWLGSEGIEMPRFLLYFLLWKVQWIRGEGVTLNMPPYGLLKCI